MKDLYSENYKILLKEIKVISKWKDIYSHGLKELTVLIRFQYHPMRATDSMKSLPKSQWQFCRKKDPP